MIQKDHFFKFIEALKLHESRKADQFFSLIQVIISFYEQPSTKNRTHFICLIFLIQGLPATRFQRNFRNQKREADIKYYTDLLLDKTFSVKQFLVALADERNCMYFNCMYSFA